jgi:hypothetical protein
MQTDQRGDLQIAAAGWLADVPWQLFATLKFPSPRIRFEMAHSKFHAMLNIVAHSIRSRVGALYAFETRSKRDGSVVPLHIHSAITALRPIEHQMVSGAWAGRSFRNSSIPELAQVESYNAARAGVEYIVKQAADDTGCEWGMRDVEFFSPTLPVPHMSSRAARRWREQHSLAKKF